MSLETLAAALHASELAHTLRASIWLYPLINTGHVIGIGLLFGAIVPLDLRLLGCWSGVPLDHLPRALLPVTIAGLLLALGTGSLLFATRPLDYIVEPLFAIKMALLCAALINALVLRLSPQWRWARVSAGGTVPPSWRVAALASLLLWIGVITAGRLIGYR
ncbi:MAG TPA: hypothetical protein VF169_05570 [Albitalea sp.]|uniref:hypothetical protein n=1 Tax=Piscinibacter sp. TaxID=1903157 RepID=UPI002ED5C70E